MVIDVIVVSGNTWYSLEIKEVLTRLSTNELGLNDSEANSRLDKYGYNRFGELKSRSIFLIFLKQFQNPLIYILIIAGLITALSTVYVIKKRKN